MAFALSPNQIAVIQSRDPGFQAPLSGGIRADDPYAAAAGWADNTQAQADPALLAMLRGGSSLPSMGTTQTGPAVPLTGLAGSEQAMMQYLQQAMQQMNQANQQSGQQMQQGFQQALGQLQQGMQGSEQVQREQAQAAMGQIQNPVNIGTGGAEAYLNPLVNPGQSASQQQAALSGAMGPQAQQAAMQAFQSSPEQAYLREQQERAVMRNAAATGGLNSGNVLMELQRQAAGIASQDFGNAFNRLGTVADRGANAAGAMSGILSGAARDSAGINASRDMARAELQSGLGQSIGGQRFGAGQLGAEGAFTLGQNLGQNTFRTGGANADMTFGTGTNLAAGRTRAGEQMAGQYAQTAQQLAQLQSALGGGTADLIGQNTGNLANLLTGQGMNQQQIQQVLATLLANISTGSASQFAGVPGIPQVGQNPGILGGIGQAAAGSAAFKKEFGL
jgi:hypothetical protein